VTVTQPYQHGHFARYKLRRTQKKSCMPNIEKFVKKKSFKKL